MAHRGSDPCKVGRQPVANRHNQRFGYVVRVQLRNSLDQLWRGHRRGLKNRQDFRLLGDFVLPAENRTLGRDEIDASGKAFFDQRAADGCGYFATWKCYQHDANHMNTVTYHIEWAVWFAVTSR